jgi:glycosyltransferase involved in cell wall biosynthesis
MVPSRVALISAYFWPERLGCAAPISDVARYLKRNVGNLDVFAAVPHYPSKRAAINWDLVANDELRDTPIVRAWVFDRSGGGFGIRLLNDWLFAAQACAASVLMGSDWEAVMLLAPPALTIPWVRIAKPRPRLVAAVYDIESTLACETGIVPGKFSLFLNAFEGWCLNRADAILVLTPQMKRTLESIGVKRPISVVPIWPSIEGGEPEKKKHSNTLMYAGGLARRHGSHVLPELWRQLQVNLPGSRLIIQGEESQFAETKKALQEVGGEVTFRPTVPRDLLAQTLAESDLQLVLVLDSASNSSIPSKAITSLAAGIPFLTNAPLTSALADLALTSGGGHVVSGGTPQALAEAATNLLGAPDILRNMGISGGAYVRRAHSRNELLQQYFDLLLGVSLLE